MSEPPVVQRQWEHIVPPAGYTYTEQAQDPDTGEATFKVTCYAPREPDTPILPDATGTWEDWIGRHHVKIDWIYKDGAFDIVDFDMTISLDEEIG
jgi:hypothetical protein